MSINQIFLTGRVKYPTFYAPGDTTKKGNQVKYPMMSCQLSFGDVHLRDGVAPIGGQAMWIDVYPPTLKGSQQLDVAAGRRWKEMVESGYSFATLVDAHFRTSKDGTGRVKVSFKNMWLSNEQDSQGPMNRVILQGQAEVANANWFSVVEHYRVPNEKDPAKAWKSRKIPVFTLGSTAGLNERNVLVFGELSARTPDNKEAPIIVAREIR